MKRWDGSKFSENNKIDTFLAEIKSICIKHGFSISHEDSHGAFEINKYNEDNIDWLFGANDRT